MESREKISQDRIRRLKIVLTLVSSYILVEIIGGLLTGSLALIADAGQMLTDAAGVGLALLAVSFSRKPPSPKRTYGFYRMEILAALANSIALIFVAGYVTYEAYQRIFEPPEIQGLSMVAIASVGLAVNLLALRLLNKYSNEGEEESLNMRAAYLDALNDTLGSAGAIAAGIVIVTINFNLIDPIISFGLAAFILYRTWSILKRAIHVLMEGVPVNVPYEEVKKEMLKIKGVKDVFDLHIWTITSGMDALTAHVVIDNKIMEAQSVTDISRMLEEISSMLAKKCKITHTTIQIEASHAHLSDNTF